MAVDGDEPLNSITYYRLWVGDSKETDTEIYTNIWHRQYLRTPLEFDLIGSWRNEKRYGLSKKMTVPKKTNVNNG